MACSLDHSSLLAAALSPSCERLIFVGLAPQLARCSWALATWKLLSRCRASFGIYDWSSGFGFSLGGHVVFLVVYRAGIWRSSIIWNVGETWQLRPRCEHPHHIAWVCIRLWSLPSRQVHVVRLLLQMQILVQVGVISPLVLKWPTLTLRSHPVDILCSLLAAH